MEFKSGGGGVGVISLPLLNCCKVPLDPGFIASIQLIRSSCVCERKKRREKTDSYITQLPKFLLTPWHPAQLSCTYVGAGVEYPRGSLSFEVDLKGKADSFDRVHRYLGNMGQQHLGMGLGLQEREEPVSHVMLHHNLIPSPLLTFPEWKGGQYVG